MVKQFFNIVIDLLVCSLEYSFRICTDYLQFILETSLKRNQVQLAILLKKGAYLRLGF